METNKGSFWSRLLNAFKGTKEHVYNATLIENTQLRKQIHTLEQQLSDNNLINEDDEFGPVNLNDIDPDDLIEDQSFEGVVAQIPEGWFAFEMGQSPVHMLWYCQLILFESLYTDPEDPQAIPDALRVYSEERNTLKEALLECIHKIEIEEYAENV